MKFLFLFLILAGVCSAATSAKKGSDEHDSGWMDFVKMVYKQICKPEPGENRCVELTKETYKNVLTPYRPTIKAKCKEWKAAGKFYLHWPCIVLIKTIPKVEE